MDLMDNNMNYEQLADNLCEIHFLYSRDLANVFEQRSTRGEEAALFWLLKLGGTASAGELGSLPAGSPISGAVWSGRN